MPGSTAPALQHALRPLAATGAAARQALFASPAPPRTSPSPPTRTASTAAHTPCLACLRPPGGCTTRQFYCSHHPYAAAPIEPAPLQLPPSSSPPHPCRHGGLLHDPLLPRMFPPDDPEVSRACQLCAAALEQQRATLVSGAHQPPAARRLQPSADTPLSIRGVAMVRLVRSR